MNYDLYYTEIVSGQLLGYNQTCKISGPMTKRCYPLDLCVVAFYIWLTPFLLSSF